METALLSTLDKVSQIFIFISIFRSILPLSQATSLTCLHYLGAGGVVKYHTDGLAFTPDKHSLSSRKQDLISNLCVLHPNLIHDDESDTTYLS